MKKTIINLSSRTKDVKCPVKSNSFPRRARYNNTMMKPTTVFWSGSFSGRLSALRIAKGISAREMSLNLGQGAGYINNIENGKNFPSLAMFFEICEYLEISPREFFDYEESSADLYRDNWKRFKELSREDQLVLLELIRILNKLKK